MNFSSENFTVQEGGRYYPGNKESLTDSQINAELFSE